jgi:hypothetical protein
MPIDGFGLWCGQASHRAWVWVCGGCGGVPSLLKTELTSLSLCRVDICRMAASSCCLLLSATSWASDGAKRSADMAAK